MLTEKHLIKDIYIWHSKKFKIKAKNNKSFQALQKEPSFLKLVG